MARIGGDGVYKSRARRKEVSLRVVGISYPGRNGPVVYGSRGFY